MYQKLIRFVLISAVFTALFACSSEPTQVPKELVEIKNPIKVKRIWDKGVGDGDDELQLQLEPLISGPDIFTVDIEGDVQARDRTTGALKWEVELDQRISGGISGDSTRLYVSSFQGEVIALARSDGAELWRSLLSSEALSVGMSDGSTLVILGSDGRVYAFDTSSGDQRWRYDSATPILSIRGTSSPEIRENTVLVSLATGEFVALDLATGRVVWEISLANAAGRTELERLVDADGDFAELYGTLFATAFQGELKAIDARTGTEVWSKPLSSYTGVAVDRESGLVISSLADGSMAAFEGASGKEVWESDELQYRRLGRVVVVSNYVAVSDFEGYVHFFDLASGKIVGRVRPDSDGVMGRMKSVANTLYVYTRSGDLFAYRVGENK